MDSLKVIIFPLFVITAKAGIHSPTGRGQAFKIHTSFWIPAFARMTTICEAINFDLKLKVSSQSNLVVFIIIK